MFFVSIIVFFTFAVLLGCSCIILLTFFLIKILTSQWTSWCCWSLPPKLTLGKLKKRKKAWVWRTNLKLRPPRKMKRLMWAGPWARGHEGMDFHKMGERGSVRGDLVNSSLAHLPSLSGAVVSLIATAVVGSSSSAWGWQRKAGG